MLEVLLFIVLAGGLTGLSFFFQTWSNQSSGMAKQFPTPQDVAQREREIAQKERARSQKLAAKLRELGIDPDKL